MTTTEKIQKFADMLAAPDGTAWVRIEEKQNKKTWRWARPANRFLMTFK